MSKFVHKVKDAMTDDRKDTNQAPGYRAPQDYHGTSNIRAAELNPDQTNPSRVNTSSGLGPNNPYSSRHRSDDNTGTYRDSKLNDTRSSSDPDTHGSMASVGDTSTRATSAGSGNVDAGSHDSTPPKATNAPVGSTINDRGQHLGATNPEMSGNAPTSINPKGNSPTQSFDNHTSSQDDYSKSTQEKKYQSRPSDNSDQTGQSTSEESHETSTQEHKSHSATSHVTQCDPQMPNEPRFGGSAASGSSGAQGVRQQVDPDTDPLSKLDARVTPQNAQPRYADQRSGY